MINMLASVWALLAGVVLIMLGNGMHFTLMGLRGGVEGFSSAELSIVTSGYFLGFFVGRAFHTAPDPARRSCAGVCSARQFYLGGAHRLYAMGRALDMDAPADLDRFLHVGDLCGCRKLAQQFHQQ